MIMCFGCVFGFISCVWIWYCYLEISIWEVYAMAAFFGIGGTFMLIGSLSMTSDLIDANKVSSTQYTVHPDGGEHMVARC